MSNTVLDKTTPLRPGEVRVFRAGLDLPAERSQALFVLLSPDEKARAERFVFEVHRRRFAAARGLLREVLGGLLRAAPARLRFEYGPRGKPRLGGEARIRFNVSHSGDRALFAIAHDRELGVDIEAVRTGIDHAAIAARFFSASEQRALLELPEPERAAAFFAVWTRKEAYLKLVGFGLQGGLDGFDVSLDEPARLLRVSDRESSERISLHSLAVPDAFRAALACDGGPVAIERVDLD